MKGSAYSIKDLEHLTGIKAHTIRIWEQRYNLLNPERTDTNIRLYSDDDLKKILNINMLYTSGIKISKIAQLSNEEIIAKYKELTKESGADHPQKIEELINAIIELNSYEIHKQLNVLYNQSGMLGMYEESIIPLLHRLGELWQLNTIAVAHEHFFSNCFREFLLAKTNAFEPAKNGTRVLFFLHQYEEHELSLLIYHYLLRERGWNCVYLGQNVPTEDIFHSWNQLKPEFAVTSLINFGTKELFEDVLNEITDVIPSESLVLSGHNTVKFKELIPESIRLIQSKEDFNRIFS